MTNEELIAYQKRMRAFAETEIGAAFTAFDRAHGSAWTLDTESGYMESGAADRRADKAWEKERETRKKLMAILMPLAGIEVPTEPRT